MSEYTAQVVWTRGADEAFVDNQYSRGHEWQFDGGATLIQKKHLWHPCPAATCCFF